MILTVATIWRGVDAGERRQGRDGHRLVELVQRVDPLVVDHREPGLAGEMVAAAGEGRGDLDALAGQRLGDRRRGLVLVDVVGIEARRDHGRRAGGLELGDVVGRQHAGPWRS